jgi:hypothetical protein
MNLRMIAAIVLTIVLPALSVSWCTVHDRMLESGLSKVLPGMSPSQVIAIMGAPSWDDRCNATLPTGVPKPCTRELGYAPVLGLGPVYPRYYLIWFGADGLVTRTAPITSRSLHVPRDLRQRQLSSLALV